MRHSGTVFQWRTVSSEPVQVGDVTVTARSQALIVRLPFGGFAWHRPTEVLVVGHGQSRAVKIVDVTRVLQLAMVTIGIFFWIVAGRKAGGRKER